MRCAFFLPKSWYNKNVKEFIIIYDRRINNWLHENVCKKNYPDSIGILLRESYEKGSIRNEDDFMEVLKCVTS